MKLNIPNIAKMQLLIAALLICECNLFAQVHNLEFYDGNFSFRADTSLNIHLNIQPNNKSVIDFYNALNSSDYKNMIANLLDYKEKHKLNDWFFYQLVRKVAEEISPKKKDYFKYTLYKWFFMVKSGYDAKVSLGNNQIIFYIRSDEDISDIPYFLIDGKKYIFLNYHDYGRLFKQENSYIPVNVTSSEIRTAFSYKVTRMPNFKPENYIEKQLSFNYKHKSYHFEIKLNSEIDNIFNNYPVVDFETYFNIPFSNVTYQSLIPILKENIKKMKVKNGVDYLMQFTRYAFLYENDDENFGKEKRLSPEQTLLNKYSDCDDRAALFFYLVKEIYNLPMIALLYPTHITMAVQFNKPIGTTILFNGKPYTVCEPTPQKQNLKLGEMATRFKQMPYKIVYQYEPK